MRQLVLEKENSEFKHVKLRLKIDLVSYPARAEGLVNRIIQEKWLLFNRSDYLKLLYFDLRPEQNAIQGDAPEGSDTFQWQLGEEIGWAEIG